MSVILDLLYREYCRARLAEMRKQLLLSVANDETPAANGDASDLAGLDDRATASVRTPRQTSPNHLVSASARSTSELGIVAPLEHHG